MEDYIKLLKERSCKEHYFIMNLMCDVGVCRTCNIELRVYEIIREIEKLNPQFYKRQF
jgi:hypothetical protein